MLTYNDLAEILHLENEIDEAQVKLDRIQNSPLGRLPFVRANLHHRQINLNVQRIQIKAAKEYTESYLNIR